MKTEPPKAGYRHLHSALTGLATCVGMLATTAAAAATPAGSAPPQTAALAGTAWAVSALRDGQSAVVAVRSDSRPTVQFGADGRITGMGGCNRFNGRYTLQADGAIAISALASTRRTCVDDELMGQEDALLKALGSATRITRVADRLELHQADGALAATLVLTPG